MPGGRHDPGEAGTDSPLKWSAAADLVRAKIADGKLWPGGPAPSSRALARETGFAVITCRHALRELVREGALVPGVSATARLRVARPDGEISPVDSLGCRLARTLAALRRAEGLSQPELAAKLGSSPTAVGHAETGRLWQSREFWFKVDGLLGGGILRLYDDFAAGETASAQGEASDTAAVVLPVSVTITAAGVTALWPDGSETVARPPGGLTAAS
jgi:hypothetical protein